MHYSITLPQLILQLDQVEGRKKFQKIVHILQSAGAPFEERFEYALFGPYSDTLKAELDHLHAFHILNEEQHGNAYLFSKGERFQELVETGLLSEVPEWAGFAKKLNKKQPKELEALSTLLFLIDRGYQGADLEPKFKELKAHLSDFFESSKTLAEQISQKPKDWPAIEAAV